MSRSPSDALGPEEILRDLLRLDPGLRVARYYRDGRPGVYRFAFGMTPASFRRYFGTPPRRPAKGRRLALRGLELTGLDSLTPHPVWTRRAGSARI